jgi:hypothetical protein
MPFEMPLDCTGKQVTTFTYYYQSKVPLETASMRPLGRHWDGQQASSGVFLLAVELVINLGVMVTGGISESSGVKCQYLVPVCGLPLQESGLLSRNQRHWQAILVLF